MQVPVFPLESHSVSHMEDRPESLRGHRSMLERGLTLVPGFVVENRWGKRTKLSRDHACKCFFLALEHESHCWKHGNPGNDKALNPREVHHIFAQRVFHHRSTTLAYKMSSKQQIDCSMFNQNYTVPIKTETLVLFFAQGFLHRMIFTEPGECWSTNHETRTSVCSVNLPRTDPSNYAVDQPPPPPRLWRLGPPSSGAP